MSETSTTAMLVGTPDMFAARLNAITATVPRDEIEEALTSEPPAELILEILRRTEDESDIQRSTVNVAWTQKDLESLLHLPGADAVTFYFDQAELEQLLDDAEVEGHGLREAAVVLSIAAAAAVGAGNAAANSYPDAAGASPSQAVVGGHDEASLLERGIGVQSAATVHDEASLADRGVGVQTSSAHDEASLSDRGIGVQAATPARDEASLTDRGIEPGTTAASHDEASLTARGIEAGTVRASHDEASLTDRGIEPGTIAASHDESSLTARGIEPGTVPASHDEASLTARGIERVAAVHDEASLTARGIEPGTVPAIHDEASLTTRGITPEPVAVTDSGPRFEFPSVDPGTAAALTGALAGAGLLIAAAAFATRRRELGHP